LAALVAITVGLWRVLGHNTPAGQLPLMNIDSGNIVTFERDFNQATDQTRVIVLLSPT
jgi:hypothetical protein